MKVSFMVTQTRNIKHRVYILFPNKFMMYFTKCWTISYFEFFSKNFEVWFDFWSLSVMIHKERMQKAFFMVSKRYLKFSKILFQKWTKKFNLRLPTSIWFQNDSPFSDQVCSSLQ